MLVQVHLQELKYGEKVIFFLQLISKSETLIDFRFITCKVKQFKCFLFLFWWLDLTANESQKSVSQNIRIFTFYLFHDIHIFWDVPVHSVKLDGWCKQQKRVLLGLSFSETKLNCGTNYTEPNGGFTIKWLVQLTKIKTNYVSTSK